jgi:hypothetical protein
MNTRQSWIIGAAIIIGCLILNLSLSGRSGAEPAIKAQQWEYKIVELESDYVIMKDREASLSKNLNDLAADRWEYIGLVATGNGKQQPKGLVAFRRPKQ